MTCSKQLALVMPPETRQRVAAALELLTDLAEDAILGRAGDVVVLKAPQ
jgi:hypothetical protein